MAPTPPEDGISYALRILRDAPDSPEGLRIQSVVNASIAPRNAAAENAIDAIETHTMAPSAETERRLQAAREDYFSATGLDSERHSDFWTGIEREAAARLEAKQNRPPAMESILDLPQRTADAEYELGIGLGGLQGTWHRLWASISIAEYLGEELGRDLVATIRADFEGKLGRAISLREWDALSTHASEHSAKIAAHR
jgi:hypothetical protein